MKLTPARVDVVVWSAIYGGLLLLGFGLALNSELPAAGWAMAALGVLAALLGVVLIGVRSRMTDAGATPAAAKPAQRAAPDTSGRKP